MRHYYSPSIMPRNEEVPIKVQHSAYVIQNSGKWFVPCIELQAFYCICSTCVLEQEVSLELLSM